MKYSQIKYDNSVDVTNPTWWASEVLLQFFNLCRLPGLINTQYSNEVAEAGKTVTAIMPGTFEARRKANTSAITVQDANATNIDVTLNQHAHVSYGLTDRDFSLSAYDLISTFMVPAARAIAEYVEYSIQSQAYSLIYGSNSNVIGKLGTAVDEDAILAARTLLNQKGCPDYNRVCMLNNAGDGQVRKIDRLTSAAVLGERGSAIRGGFLGSLHGLECFASTRLPYTPSGTLVLYATSAVNNTSGYAAGATSMVIDTTTTGAAVGSWFRVAGDEQPHFITAATATSLTFAPALKYAVADNAAVYLYKPMVCNHPSAGTYASGYEEMVGFDSLTTTYPGLGHPVSTGTTTSNYKMYGVTNTLTATSGLQVDRPLDAALANDAVIGVVPDGGGLNLVFHPDWVTMVSRPLALTGQLFNSGVRMGIQNYNNVTMRVTLGYDMNYQKNMVTFDLLYGLKVLHDNYLVGIYN